MMMHSAQSCNPQSAMLLDDLRWRGLIHQTTDDAARHMAGREASHRFTPVSIRRPTVCTSAILLPLLLLRRFQLAGHKPIAVVGGATGMIGDPSGKSEERNLLSLDQLERNVAGIREQMRRFLDFDAGQTPPARQQSRLDRPILATSNSCATSARTFQST